MKSRYALFGLLASLAFVDAVATPPHDSSLDAAAWSYSTGGNPTASSDATSHSDASSQNHYLSTTTVERSVGVLIMGTVIPVDCGFGGQAGGADRGGSGFLGLTWTTDRCYTLKAATAWAAMGEYELACEMLVDVTKHALKRRHRQPDCVIIGRDLRAAHTPPAPVAPQVPVVTQQESTVPYIVTMPAGVPVTQEEMREYVNRVFRKSVSK